LCCSGGPEILTNEAGTDATAKFEEVFHSEDARKQLRDFCVGTLAGYTGPANAAMGKKKSGGGATGTESQGAGTVIYIAAAAAVGALVYLFVL
jgi:cytochrome b involved in lipid metabolism